MISENKKKAYTYIRQWKKENTKRIYIEFNLSKDAQLLALLESKPNRSAYIKGLIQKDLKK